MINQEETAKQQKDSTGSARIVYNKPPPPWEAIRGAEASSDMNLDDYVSMNQNSTAAHLGTVLDVRQFLAFGRE
jgi:hypothetical protein